ELLTLMSINLFEVDGFEADDLIGTLSNYASEKGIEVYVVTGDRDALQLAKDNVKVVINKKGMTEKEIYDEKRMIDEFGVTPKQFIDVKGLMGDKSDNIPGVPGIGEKTAYKLIIEYGSIENVLQNIDNISGNKIKQNLMDYSEQAIFSKKLATIIVDVPIEIDMESIKSKDNYDSVSLKELFMKLGFRTLLSKIPENTTMNTENTENTAEIEVDSEVIDKLSELEALVKNINKNINKNIYLTYNTLNLNVYSKSEIDKIFLNVDEKIYIIETRKLLSDDREKTLFCLREIFENDKIEKIGYDFKALYSILRKMGIVLKRVKFDIKIAAYLINSSKGQYELQDILQDFLRIDIKNEDDKKEIKQSALLKQLYSILEDNIKQLNMEELLYGMEQPLIEALAYMENEGFKVNKDMLSELGDKFSKEIDSVQKEIYDMAGEEFNVSSPKQLGKILFEKLDLPVIKKTKTGYSTNAEVLEQLSDKHPIIDKVTYYRQLTKLYSTYVEGLKSVIDVDDKIHSSFNQTVTTTGRLSSTEPNLQNIPIKYELGREIRKVFIPNNSDSVILSADYSQIELRVLAHIAADDNLIDAFKHHIDIHTKTASEVFKVPIDEVTHLMRSRAKAVNFGIVYGIGDFSLAKDLKITKAEAKSYIDTYLERYPGVKKYMTDTVKQAENEGYVLTIFNRRRYLPEISSSNRIVKALGDRLAMNTPIQGSAADIIKLAMIKVFNEIRDRKLKSTLILQVHDELILNVYKDELEEVKRIVKKQMENVVSLNVPMEVDINVGDTWFEAK
ncbi:MAG: DNA polymerase I, partial [Bacillota bacterium]|nr:DNA polymerase I [Bacillota bacterium]